MRQSGLFSFTKEETEYLDKEQGKAELMGCPYEGRKCKKQLKVIHKHYLDSSKYQKEKKYKLAIKFLQSAYSKTDELQDSTCGKCIELFRATLTNSMEDIQRELCKMKKGIFRSRRYDDVYTEAQKALNEFNHNS